MFGVDDLCDGCEREGEQCSHRRLVRTATAAGLRTICTRPGQGRSHRRLTRDEHAAGAVALVGGLVVGVGQGR